MDSTIGDTASGVVVSCVIKRIMNYPSHTEEKIVSVKVGDSAESDAELLVKQLNESCTCDIERYEYETHSNELADVGMNHRNEAFLVPALAREVAEEVLQALSLSAVTQPSIHPFQKAVNKLASRVTHCETMTREKVEKIAFNEVKDGIDPNASWMANNLYRRSKKSIDLMAALFGMKIKNSQ